jgi:hypothetical protein
VRTAGSPVGKAPNLHEYMLRGGFLDRSRGILMTVILGQYSSHR